MKKLLSSGVRVALLFALASPSFAHWGPASAWTAVNKTNYCEHEHDGFDWRRVRVKGLPVAFEVCAEFGCAGENFADSEVKNVTGNNAYRADIFLVGVDGNIPAGGWPYMAAFQNVENNGKRLLSSVYGGWFLYNLRAYCVAGDQATF